MDRLTNYFGQIPLETDLLHTNQNTMVALAKLAAGVLGTSTIVNGLSVTPTTPASLSVLLNAGEIYQIETLEATAWSSLPADTTHSILKQGILLDAVTYGITPPGTSGYSQVFLIEVQYADQDTGSTVLPYFNASNPSLPFSGPGNSGSTNNTVRKGIVASQVKAGVASATGTQVAPTADAGWTGLFTVTVANGASTITAGNIAQLASAPFIPATLPMIPSGVQKNSWTYAADTGTASNLAVSISPAPSAYTTGMGLIVKAAAVPTGASVINVNGLGNVGLVHGDGSAIVANDWAAGSMLGLWYDGTHFQVAFKGQAELQAPNLIASQTYYVNATSGNDSNNGLTSGTAFQTIQHAINVMNTFNLNGYSVTINVANGTYAPFICNVINGSGACNIIGNVTTPANCLIHSTAGEAIQVFGSGYTIQGLKVQCDTDGTLPHIGAGIRMEGGSTLALRCMEFGTCSSYHMFINGNSRVGVAGALGGDFGNFLTFSGGVGAHSISVNDVSNITMTGPILNYTGTLTWNGGNGATVYCFGCASISMGGSTINVTGTVTGYRYSAQMNGIISVNGGGANYLPGSLAGTATFGGQYA